MALAGFVPDHSDGVAADSHRLPWGPHAAGRPDIVYDTATLTEPGWTRQAEGDTPAEASSGVSLCGDDGPHGAGGAESPGLLHLDARLLHARELVEDQTHEVRGERFDEVKA